MKLNGYKNKILKATLLILLFALPLVYSPQSIIPLTSETSSNAILSSSKANISMDTALNNLQLVLKAQAENETTNRTVYQKVWEPNIAQAAVHTVAVSDDGLIMAAAGGYLKDNEIHVYTYDYVYKKVFHVTDLGDGIINNDIQSLAIDDMDNNGYYEIIAGSSDGYIYVFEQTTSMMTLSEEPFVFTWKSNVDLIRVWSVAVDELDGDGKKEIIAGCWDNKIHVFEYETRGGFPWTDEHWQSYKEVWNSSNIISDKVYAVDTGDTDGDNFREIVASDRSGHVYIFENEYKEKNQPYPYHYDNKYALVWNSSLPSAAILENLRVNNLDNDSNDEIATSSYGHGVYFIDYTAGEGYTYTKVFKPLETWESKGFWPLDPYVDRLISNLSINIDDTPMMPYNSSLAQAPDGFYAVFNVTEGINATAVVDFGKDQEVTCDGNITTPDLYIWALVSAANEIPEPITASDLQLFASNNITNFTSLEQALINPINYNNYTRGTYNYREYRIEIKLDMAMDTAALLHFRYLKLVIKGNQDIFVDALRGTLDLSIGEVTTLFIGNIDFSANGNDTFKDKLILGTSDGRILVYQYQHTNDSEINYDGYKLQRIWDSFEEDRFSTSDAIWSMALLNKTGLIPTWELDTLFDINPYKYGFDYVDIAGNGSYDLVYADYQYEGIDSTWYGCIKYKENQGTNRKPSFAAEVRLPGTGPAGFVPFKQRELNPTFVDIDGDFDLDLVVGYSYGGLGTSPGLYLLRNDGGTFNHIVGFFSVVDSYLAIYNGTPKVAFYDMDGDGDYDMTIGHTILYYFENTGNSTNPTWEYRKDFYKSLNAQRGRYEKFGRPAFSDFDNDGDIDITVSLNYSFVSSVVNYSYATLAYFKNTGNLHNPNWIRDKTLYETDFQFYYDALLKDIDGDGNLDVIARRTHGAFTNGIFSFLSYFNHNALFTATYPEVMVLEIDKRELGIGYEVNKMWTNKLNMKNWTFSVVIADTDKDGETEIIIGSFDNNIFMFENLFNTTYRRAWKSPDLKNLESVGTPTPWWYYYVWEDVVELVVGDMDHDGSQEIAALAGEQIYIFENVGDDNYTLVETFELDSQGSSIALSEDLDGDGLSELVVTTSEVSPGKMSAIYVFELRGPVGDNQLTEIWYYEFPSTTDNGLIRYTVAETVITSDLDNDGRGEIIVGGYNETRYSNGDPKGMNDGFVWIFESQESDNFSDVWHAPYSHMTNNPISTLSIADNNKNGLSELMAGGHFGVLIYEWNSVNDNEYNLINVITSSATFPGPYYGTIISSTEVVFEENEIVQLLNGSFVAVYVSQGRLFSAYSNDGITWTLYGRITSDVGQTYESDPSLVASTIDNSAYLVFKSDMPTYTLWYTSSDDGGETWSSLEGVPSHGSNTTSPSLILGTLPIVSYIVPNVGIYYTYYSPFIPGWTAPELYDIPVNSTNIEAISLETLYLHDGSYALAISGWDKNTTKTDLDVWVFLSRNLDNWSKPIQVTSTYDNETDVAITELEKGVLMIVYENEYREVKTKVSTNGGVQWSKEQIINTDYYLHESANRHLSLITLNEGGYMFSTTDFWYTFVGGSLLPTSGLVLFKNNNTNWWYFSLEDVRAIASMDLDENGEYDLIIGAQDIVSVLEFNSTTGQYNLTWASSHLNATITDIAVGDTNGNGLGEFIVTAEGGYVFGFELADKDPPTVSLPASLSAETFFVGDKILVNIHAEDQSKVVRVETKYDDYMWAAAEKIDENTYTATIFLDSEGVHTITARAIDYMGLMSSEVSIQIKVVAKQEKSYTTPEVAFDQIIGHERLQASYTSPFSITVTIMALMALLIISEKYKYSRKH